MPGHTGGHITCTWSSAAQKSDAGTQETEIFIVQSFAGVLPRTIPTFNSPAYVELFKTGLQSKTYRTQ